MSTNGNTPSPETAPIVLEVEQITKTFPGVVANDNVDLTLRRGEILALLGENGAGKSTLMNVIYGLYRADSGSIRLRGEEVNFASPREAIHSRIGMVHQHFQLIPVMSVADNVVLGEEVTRGLLLDRAEAARRVRELSEQYNLAVDPEAIIEELPVGTQQRVEIIKALYRDAEILILDEPTSVLTPQEVQELFKIMRDLSARGVAIVFITHKLKEVLAVAHRIVVMRDGCVVGEARPENATEASLAAMMVGREVLLRVEKAPAQPKETVLHVYDLHAYDGRRHLALNGVSFEVRAGEVLGIAGVQGNGQTELVETLTGLRKLTGGSVTMHGQDVTHAVPRQITTVGTGHVPEDRHRYGMVDSYTVAENLVLNAYFRRPFAEDPTPTMLFFVVSLYSVLAVTWFTIIAALWGGFWEAVITPAFNETFNITAETAERDPARAVPLMIGLVALVVLVPLVAYLAHRLASWMMLWLRARVVNPAANPNAVGVLLNRRAINENAAQLIEAFDIRTPNAEVAGGNLSGGNQQKMVVAREFSRQPALLIAAQPTRGIDVGSIEFIHQQIVRQRDAGAAVLLVSAELDEIMALSDRIAVMYHGQIVATLRADAVTREQLGLLMAGTPVHEVFEDTAAVAA